MRLLILISVLLAFGCHAHAQGGERRIDSLLAVLDQTDADTNKVKILQDISYAYYQVDNSAGIKYGRKGLALAEKLGWETGIALCHNSLGVNYEIRGDYPRALEQYLAALKINEEQKNKKNVAANLVNIALIYENQEDYEKAIENDRKALKIYEELNENKNIAACLGNIGLIYARQKKNELALEQYLKALGILEKLNDPDQSVLLINIGEMYADEAEIATALEYYHQAREIAEKAGNRYVYVASVESIGSLYLDRAGDPGSKTKNADLAKAIKYLEVAGGDLKEMGILKEAQQTYAKLSDAYKLAGNYEKALVAHEQHMKYKDSVFNEDNARKITEIELNAAFEKRQLADSLKNEERRKIEGFRLQRQQSYTYAGLGVALLLLCFSLFIVRNNRLLGREKKKSENLLLNILPQDITKELMERGATTAKSFDNVTVLFTDFVNFTVAGERMGTEELVDELHNCFKAFDEIIGRHSLEKIKTIGDAYLAVCGLPVQHADHAQNVANAALEIRAFMLERKQALGEKTFDIRIGIHSGSVVAGIVGVKKFAYDIWGDTVNTAARMEQSSEPGKINISAATYELLKTAYNCTFRGEIEAKNKGRMGMYFLESKVTVDL